MSRFHQESPGAHWDRKLASALGVPRFLNVTLSLGITGSPLGPETGERFGVEPVLAKANLSSRLAVRPWGPESGERPSRHASPGSTGNWRALDH